jgi:hypothetical protein
MKLVQAKELQGRNEPLPDNIQAVLDQEKKRKKKQADYK